ncbi:MAG: iron chelate uptake ABC transporter family permease subunit, partial [Deltaproteobacteria bacterium]|nr:iron chelate uptake ABC transporter family permease subunit [Deltaproteobacteria bacterium]
VGASVATVGLIGFVGSVVPHMVRMRFGANHRVLLPLSAVGGGLFLLVCDFLSRTLFSGVDFQTQLPIGVVTALIGAPFFVWLLKKSA